MRLAAVALALLASTSLALAQNTGGNPLVPGGGGGGGGGPSSITFTTSCPSSTQTGSTINYINGINAIAKTASYQLVAGDCGTTFDVSGTGNTQTMPALAAGYVVAFKNTNALGGANITITAGAGQTIDGSASFTLAPLQYVQISASTTGTNYDAGTGAAGTTIPCNVGYVSGKWSGGCGSSGATGSATGGGGNVTCSPYFVSYPGATFKAIAVYVSTTDTTSTGFIWLGIYTNASGVPGTKIDDIGTTAITAPGTNNNPASGNLANTTDTLTPGPYWVCEATPSTSLIVTGVSLFSAYLMPSTTVQGAVSGSNSGAGGLQCAANSTGCGPTWTSGASYTGAANFTGATWAQRASGAAPNIALQVQ